MWNIVLNSSRTKSSEASLESCFVIINPFLMCFLLFSAIFAQMKYTQIRARKHHYLSYDGKTAETTSHHYHIHRFDAQKNR